MLVRLIDFLKSKQITALFTSLTAGGSALEQSEVGVSSLMDTWLLLRIFELGGRAEPNHVHLKSPACPLESNARVPVDRPRD